MVSGVESVVPFWIVDDFAVKIPEVDGFESFKDEGMNRMIRY